MELKMSFFDKVKMQANNLGNTISNATTKLSDELFSTNTDEKIISINSEIDDIMKELELAYAEIGKNYVEYITKSDKEPQIDVSDTLKRIQPKLKRKEELENEIVNIEKSLKDKFVMQEKSEVQKMFDIEKEKFDKALKLEVISQEEYDEKIAKAKIKLINFDEIRKIQKQYDMKLISKDEMQEKLSELGVNN